ncbi:MAG TPA: hypothetical protein VMI34_06650 [Candidatus Bathyarchaeia archaeon]|nr:hypothetical protein [Candidatus Bathyarchaeia archaeon]
MLARLLPNPSPASAAAVLREVFGRIQAPVAFRLWDGSEVRLSGDKALSTVVIKSPETFLGLIENPTPYNFAEAYVSGRVDFEGDMFSVMPVANEIEELRLSTLQKVRLFLSLWRR